MGNPRPKPERLAEKLLQIRNALGFSQTEMLKHLGVEDLIEYHSISKYELGKREPPLTILLQYARAAGVPMEVLVDDNLDLPERLPSSTNHQEIKRQYSLPKKNRVSAK